MKTGVPQNRITRTLPKKSLLARMWRHKYAYLLILPGLVYFIIYRYVPMLGLVIAFQDFSPFRGFLKSEWVGFAWFARIFSDVEVVRVIWNTLYISFLQIVCTFPFTIALSLMLNEVASKGYKRVIQSVVYLPYFVSWVVVIAMVTMFLNYNGLLNGFLSMLNPARESVAYLQKGELFVPIIMAELLWKETGWGTIIYLAALSGINPNLYEAALMDGANRWKQTWYITLPSLRGTIVILLILRLGSVLDVGFEQIFLMLNPFNRQTGEVLDTYVYYKGIEQANFSFATAVGLFKSIVGLALVLVFNRLAKQAGEEGVF